MKKLYIFDSTLRDGAQSEGVSFSIQDKLNIITALDNIGVDFIEAGNPGSNPKDIELFKKVAKLKLNNAKLVAFGSTRRCDLTAEQDKSLLSLIESGTEYVSIFGKTWDMQVTEVLKTSLEENLAMIYDSVLFAVKNGKKVIYDAEHFFDGYKNNKDYAIKTILAAKKAGAECIVLCDTNGGTFPDEIYSIVSKVNKIDEFNLGIHCHNDTECAVANSLMAVDAGATHIQGTFIGFGERCGNANLSSLIPNLQIKKNYHCIPENKLRRLYSTALYISEISNVILPNSSPYVGKSAFAHKGGMHIDAIVKTTNSFEHIEPEKVGNSRHVILSELSGRTTILTKLLEIAPTLTKDSEQTKELIEILKELELKGYEFESATASFEVLVKKHLGLFKPFFWLDYFKTIGEVFQVSGAHKTTAVIKVHVGDKDEITAAEGDGPVHALDKALRKALEVFYPNLSDVRLIDYKVRVLEQRAATASIVRVLIESTDGRRVWTTVGASKDIIKASWRALVDSIEYKLMLDSERLKED